MGNADSGSLGYITNPKVRSVLKQAFRNADGGDTPLWIDGPAYGPGFAAVNGFKAASTNQVSSTLLKAGSPNTGSHSALFYGDWSALLVCTWSGLDLLIDPFTHSSSGTVRVVGLQDVDVLVQTPESFSCMKDCVTN